MGNELQGRAGLAALRTSGMRRRTTIFPSVPPSGETIVKNGYYDEMLNTIPAIVLEFDSSGRLTFMNDTGTGVLGYSERDLEGIKGLFFVAPEERPMMRKMLTLALEGRSMEPVDFRARCSDGFDIDMRLTFAIIENGGNIIGLRAVALDITEEKRAKELLSEKEAYLETVLSNAPVVLWLTDSEGVLTYINGKGIAPGLDRDKLIGTSAFDVLPDNPQSKRNLERALAGEDFKGIVEGTGFVHRVIYNAMRDRRTGQQEGIIGVSVDITEVVSTQRKLEEAERLKTAGEAAAKAGHDINNSLSVPLCNLQFMRDIDFSPLGEAGAADIREMIGDSLNALGRCQRLVRDMMSLSRGGGMKKRSLELNGLAASVVSEARNTAREKGVLLDFSPSALECRIDGDYDMIFRALQNITKNAIEASARGSQVSIAVSIEPSDGGPKAGVTIRDSGTGIPPELIESIFQPFFTTKGEGTGLGLAISWSHINAHGGTIAVESREGAGSTFRITLPIADYR